MLFFNGIFKSLNSEYLLNQSLYIQQSDKYNGENNKFKKFLVDYYSISKLDLLYFCIKKNKEQTQGKKKQRFRYFHQLFIEFHLIN